MSPKPLYKPSKPLLMTTSTPPINATLSYTHAFETFVEHADRADTADHADTADTADHADHRRATIRFRKT